MTVIVGYGDRFERLAEELRSKFNLTNSDSEIFASMTKRGFASVLGEDHVTEVLNGEGSE